MIKIKSVLIYFTLILVGSSLNFFIFLEAYKKLAFPFIHEEQRVENAHYIFMYVLPSFILAAVLTLVLYKAVMKLCNKNS